MVFVFSLDLLTPFDGESSPRKTVVFPSALTRRRGLAGPPPRHPPSPTARSVRGTAANVCGLGAALPSLRFSWRLAPSSLGRPLRFFSARPPLTKNTDTNTSLYHPTVVAGRGAGPGTAATLPTVPVSPGAGPGSPAKCSHITLRLFYLPPVPAPCFLSWRRLPSRPPARLLSSPGKASAADTAGVTVRASLLPLAPPYRLLDIAKAMRQSFSDFPPGRGRSCAPPATREICGFPE